jgi:adenine-specific DNA-methyltransferase
MATGVSKTKWRGQHRILPAAPSKSNGSPVHVIYEGKADENAILAGPPAHLVQVWPNATSYVTAAENRLIYGDNLFVQIALLDDPQVRGKVQVAYIDPPFATGGVFHSRNQSDAYTDLLSGADYIEFLRARLILIRELLAPTGSIYVHLDGNMAFGIKLIMDEVFGPRNFRNWITRKKCNPKNYTHKVYGNVCDFILFYTKSNEYVWHRPVDAWTDARALREYQYVDEKTGRRYKKVPVHAPGIRHGATGGQWKGMSPPPGKHWQYTPAKLDEMEARGEIYWSPSGNPRRKVFLDNSAGIPVQDLWLDYRDAHNQNIRITGYPTEKNPGLLERIICASSNPGDLVLDCFSGSGTTISVASELGRKWIGIDSSVESIAVTLRRFAKGMQPMGDFVSSNNEVDVEQTSDILPLFQSLELQAQVASKNPASTTHKPITDFALSADKSVATDLSAILEQWCIDIGDTAPFAIAKETRGAYPAGMVRSPDASQCLARTRWPTATKHLITVDPILAKIIRDVGPCRLTKQTGGFAHLAQAIINQQLSKSAADAIFKRLRALAENKHLSAHSLQTLPDKALKSVGVSARKIAYLRDLADKVNSAQLDFHRLPRLSDEEVISVLTQVKGIGRWTAEMYLIFVLGRSDVLPLDDTALRSAICDAYQLKDKDDGASIAAIGDLWRPHRTLACWYLWSWRNGSQHATI